MADGQFNLIYLLIFLSHDDIWLINRFRFPRAILLEWCAELGLAKLLEWCAELGLAKEWNCVLNWGWLKSGIVC